MPRIKVHEKALAHLSRGLYRSPASALRELVSNAWDANATSVRLNTNFPNFLQIAVQDNGEGFSHDDFASLMEGGIGNSSKREVSGTPRVLIGGRPIIGKLGIGMLGIAQMCGAFTVTSRPKKGKRFRARVELYDLLRERLDRGDKEVVKDLQQNLKEVDVGNYTFLEDPGDGDTGTTIIADDVHPTFARTFQEATTFEGFREPPLDWKGCIAVTQATRSVHELGDYWRLLWELAVAAPVPYVSSRALPNSLISIDQARLTRYRFRVAVDGRTLFKPVNLHGNKDGYTTVPITPQACSVYGRALRFHGYLAVQEGLQIRPDELRGIVVRIRNVAVGYYDPSLLDYRINQGPRSRWITGEIFVDEGLEDALNIDRDSFNQFHPQFRYLQTYVHKRLDDDIFPEVYRNILDRSRTRAKQKNVARSNHLRGVLRETLGKSVRIHHSTRSGGDGAPRVNLSTAADAISVTMPAPDTLPTRRANRSIAAAVMAIFEIAVRQRSREKQRAMFTELLIKLLKEW